MSVFKCGECGCKENTAYSLAHVQMADDVDKLLCSECNPKIGKWHNRFKKRPFEGPYIRDHHGSLPLKYQHK